MTFAPPDLSIVVKISNVLEFIKWLPVTYIFTTVPLITLFKMKFLSFQFQIPTIILTMLLNKLTINYFNRKIKNDSQVRKKMIFDILDDN